MNFGVAQHECQYTWMIFSAKSNKVSASFYHVVNSSM